jgi:hypothetical protein
MLLGTGRLLFQSPQARTALRLAENLAFGNGVVPLRYVRA